MYSYDVHNSTIQPVPMSVDVFALVRDAHLAEDLRHDRDPRHTTDELPKLPAETEPELSTTGFLLADDVRDVAAAPCGLDDEEPLLTLAEATARRIEEGEDPAAAPPDAEHLIVVAYILEDTDLVVDGRTGLVLMWDRYEGEWDQYEGELTPCNTDLSILAFTLWALDLARAEGERTGLRTDSVWEVIMADVLSEVDPVAWAEGGATGRT